MIPGTVPRPRPCRRAALHDLDRMTSVAQNDLSLTTIYTYTDLDRIWTVTDPRTLVTTYGYDDYGWLTSVASPDTGTVTFDHNDAGQVTLRTDELGPTVYAYDALGRLESVDPPGTGYEITYSYDDTTGGNYGIGRLTGMSDASGSTTFVYDLAGNLIREEKTIAGQGTFATEYGYDLNGNLVSITYPDGRVVTYTMSAIDRVETVTATVDGTPENLVTSVSYLPYGPMGSFTLGSGVTTTRSFDERYAMTGIVSPGVMNRTYTVDGGWNVSVITDNRKPTENRTFNYDAEGRLSEAGGPWGTGSFGYDGSGNRLTKVLGAESTTYTISETSNHLVTAAGAEPGSFQYDLVGNLTGDGTLTYSYNANQRLETASDGGTPLGTYTYDAHGQRVFKVADSQATVFLYDLAGRLLSEYAGGSYVDYVWLNGEPVAVIGAEATEPCNDGDGDGYGDPASAECTYGEEDCDDTDPDVNPGGVEGPVGDPTCSDGLDNNCNGYTDEIDIGCRESQDWSAASAQASSLPPGGAPAGATGSEATGTLAMALLPLGFVLFLRRRIMRPREKGQRMRKPVAGVWKLLILGVVVSGVLGGSLFGWPPQARADSESVYYLYNDHLGTPQTATNAVGSLVWEASYRPYGAAEAANEGIEQNVRLPGQYLDRESGLHYNYQRTYHPGLGRYLEPDPLGQIDHSNLYPYALNNPTSLTDPTGEVVPAAVVVLVELGLSVWDAYELVGILMDECASDVAKSAATAMFLTGVLSVGGGGVAAVRHADDLYDVAKKGGKVVHVGRPTVVKKGEFVNRLYDSRHGQAGANVSGPLGRSFSPGSGISTTAAEGAKERGLNIFYPNNAEKAIIFRAKSDIPAFERTAIRGSAPETLIEPRFFDQLEVVRQFSLPAK